LCNRRWLQSGVAAQQIAQGDCLPLRFLELFVPAVLVLACRSLCLPGSALAQALGGWLQSTAKNQCFSQAVNWISGIRTQIVR